MKMTDTNRRNWSEAEDNAILNIVEQVGDKNWRLVAQEMEDQYKLKGRTGKQCRERWHNHLDPSINKGAWSKSEEELLFSLHQQHGNHWATIAEHIDGRSDNAVKNHFYSALRKRLRKYNRQNTPKITGPMRRLLQNERIAKILIHAPCDSESSH